MELVKVTEGRQAFPDGTSAPLTILEFREGDERVIKQIRVTGAAKAVNGSQEGLVKEALHLILKAGREAERDFAFMKHGDKWKEHVTWGNFWSPEPSETERQLLAQARALIVEQA